MFLTIVVKFHVMRKLSGFKQTMVGWLVVLSSCLTMTHSISYSVTTFMIYGKVFLTNLFCRRGSRGALDDLDESRLLDEVLVGDASLAAVDGALPQVAIAVQGATG